MKDFKTILSISCLLLIGLIGCKTQETKTDIKDECYQYALKSPETREYGVGEAFSVSDAKAIAEADARAAFAAKLNTIILSSIEKKVNIEKTHTATPTSNYNEQTDNTEAIRTFIEKIKLTELSNTTTVKANVYKLKNGKYEVHVCIEYTKGISKLADDIIKAFEDQYSSGKTLQESTIEYQY